MVLVNKGMVHLEGGWPKEVDCAEVEQTIRYRRKVPLYAIPGVDAHVLARGGPEEHYARSLDPGS